MYLGIHENSKAVFAMFFFQMVENVTLVLTINKSFKEAG